MITKEDLRPGDEVTIRGTVALFQQLYRPDPPGPALVVEFRPPNTSCEGITSVEVGLDDVVTHEPAPGPAPEVGDYVQHEVGYSGWLLAIHEGAAWVRVTSEDTEFHLTFFLSDLTVLKEQP